ncbi:DinB family protein [Rubrivirga marina]|uniref:Damage-inducible protein DinB n=1 Tax=Rubrivirga marina TaxID=1196024 RepID=A0A271IWW2_9BACT|nr:DinB family protein [Rubrivirga marina]PAP75703.1 hypothetical protein BSZ37_04250 [Rubrivirga marina]
MTAPDAVRRRFRHHVWAGSTLLGVIADHPAPDALRPFAHALAADRVWHHRLAGAPTDGLEIWPALDVDGCRALLQETTDDWQAFLAGPLDLDGPAVYQNSRGEPFESAVRDVFDHVLLHAAHHRGQANAALRAAGATPRALDFIFWARSGEPAP